jgi:hypothetical protein
MQFPQKGRGAKGLALLLGGGLCLAVSGCAVAPFGNELTENAAAQSTGAPMPIEATYTQTVPASAAAAPQPIAAVSTPSPPVADQALVTPPVAGGASLLSPEEKERVIAELEALAKKQGAELTAERAKAAAACDNLSADDLRKKMLQGEC